MGECMGYEDFFGEEYGVDTPILEALGRREVSDWHKPVIGRYHASQLPMCLFKQFMSFQILDVAFQPRQSPRMWVGSVLHSAILTDIIPHVSKAFTVVASEVPVFYGLDGCRGAMIVGKFDHLVVMPDGELAIIDVKSMETLRFIREQGASLHYARQLAVYQAAAHIHRGFIWAIGVADRFEEEIVPCPFQQVNFDFVVGQAKLLHSCVLTDTPPPAQPSYEWECVNARFKCPYFGRECPRFDKFGELVKKEGEGNVGSGVP